MMKIEELEQLPLGIQIVHLKLITIGWIILKTFITQKDRKYFCKILTRFVDVDGNAVDMDYENQADMCELVRALIAGGII